MDDQEPNTEMLEVAQSMEAPHRRTRRPYVNVTVALSPEQAGAMRQDAQAHGLSITAFLRQLWLAYRQAQTERVEKR